MNTTRYERALIVSLISILLIGCFLGAQCSISEHIMPDVGSTVPSDQQDLQTAALLFEELSKYLPEEFYERIHNEWGIQPIALVTSWAIDPDKDGHWNPDKTDHALNQYVKKGWLPPDYDGYICLDWEHPWMGYLCGEYDNKAGMDGRGGWRYGPGTPEGRKALQDGLGLLRRFKRHWPNARIGFYGLPTREYWHQDETWRNNARSVLPILFAECDYVSPSCYEIYGTQRKRNGRLVEAEGAKDHYIKRYQEIVRLSLELAGDKPVIPWIHGHWHANAKPPYAGQQIPAERYRWFIESLKAVEVEGKSIQGAIQYGLTIREKEADRLFCILMDIFGMEECGVEYVDVPMPQWK